LIGNPIFFNKDFQGSQEISVERKKCDLLAPEVPHVIRRLYKKDQSSIGASLNGFK
jgi:hypothetical protein